MDESLDYSFAIQVTEHQYNKAKQEKHLTKEQLEDKRANRIIATCIIVAIVGSSLANIFFPV